MIFSLLTNKGFIIKAKFNCASGTAFNLLDRDRGGKLTGADFMVGFDIFDTDHDGKVLASSFSFAVLESKND